MKPQATTALDRMQAALPPSEAAKFAEHLRYEAVYTDVLTQMRLLMSAKGVSQRDLAGRMVTSESAISRLLNLDHVRNIKLETLVRFARALDVRLAGSFFDDASLAALDARDEPSRGGSGVFDDALNDDAEWPSPQVVQPETTIWCSNVAHPARYHAPAVTWEPVRNAPTALVG